jgi:hypothetical protein
VPRLQYDRSNLERAFQATQKGTSVYKAAKLYNVPESTLRDRTRGNVSLEAKPGVNPLFSLDEERELVHHIKYMGDIGYGYNKAEIQYMARDFALSLGKPVKSKDAMSNSWFYDFLARWPELKMVMPQKLSIARARAASKENLDAYYKELGNILSTNNLFDHPERIYNIDETGVSTQHTPSKIVCGKDTVAQSVTSPRSSNVTIIAGGNAIGNHIPPYYVFPGARWNADLLSGATPGSDGEMTKSGWSNSTVFTNYLCKHFAKYVPLTREQDGEKTLILYDGHKSHILLTLTEWAQKNNVILFVLPPHSSHLTQPLDVGIFGPFKSMFRNECHTYMKLNPGMSITKYNLAELTSKPYIKAMRPENLMSAFRKAGVYPFNCQVITPSQVAPAVIYKAIEPTQDDSTAPVSLHVSNINAPTDKEPSSYAPVPETPNIDKLQSVTPAHQFFQKRTITNVVPAKKQKPKFVPPFIAGNLLKKTNVEILQSCAEKKMKSEQCHESNKSQKRPIGNKVKTSKSRTNNNKEPVASTSGLNQGGKPISLSPEQSLTDSESDVSVEEDDLCCICHDWQPEDLRGCQSVCFVKWGKCDYCPHWTHLKYCTNVTVLRRDSEFRCPHCPPQEE